MRSRRGAPTIRIGMCPSISTPRTLWGGGTATTRKPGTERQRQSSISLICYQTITQTCLTLLSSIAPWVHLLPHTFIEANANWRVVAHTSVLYEGGDGSAKDGGAAKDGSAAHHTADSVEGVENSPSADTRLGQVITFNGGHGVAKTAGGAWETANQQVGAPTPLPTRIVQGHDAASTAASQSSGSVAYKPFLFPLWALLWTSCVAGLCGSL